MSERTRDKASKKGREAKRSHLTLVGTVDQEVFEDDPMPWDDEGLSAGSQGSEVDGPEVYRPEVDGPEAGGPEAIGAETVDLKPAGPGWTNP